MKRFLAALPFLLLARASQCQSGDRVAGLVPLSEEMPSIPEGKRTRSSTMRQPSVILAVTPLADVGFAEVRAALPGGRLVLIAVIRDFRKADERMLVLTNPVTVPKGTRIFSDPRVSLELVLGRPEQPGKPEKQATCPAGACPQNPDIDPSRMP